MVEIVVVGSINLDLVVTVPGELPRPGETVTEARFATHPGGKGANQALAARRLGADVRMIGRVGKDENAKIALSLLTSGGVTLDSISIDPIEPTGVAVIVVSGSGENQIVVAPGANRQLRKEDVIVGVPDAVICQLEIPVEVVDEVSRSIDTFFVLNAAPVRSLPDELIARCDLIVVNETEHAQLAETLSQAQGLVALTLGAQGARLLQGGEEVAFATPAAVEVVDTVGAGDTFVAALTVGLAEGRQPAEALRRAVTAGALATTRPGAQPSLPSIEELETAMEQQL